MDFMNLTVQCAFCPKRAEHYYTTLDLTLWAVCPRHTFPFEKIAVELDPSRYDLEAYFSEYLETNP